MKDWVLFFFVFNLVPVNVMVMMDVEYIVYIEILEMPNLPENLEPKVNLK
jgi:hypothetical protein